MISIRNKKSRTNNKGKSQMNMHWWSLLAGILLVSSGALTLFTGKSGHYWDVAVPVWAGSFFLPLGIIIIAMSVRALRRGEGKKIEYSDEDVKRAKAELDRLYLCEHGSPPESPKSEEGNPVATETKKTTQANQ